MQCFTLTMWDVKSVVFIIAQRKKSEFYLNYVGCKVSTFEIHHSSSSPFYLNYVGCKGFISNIKFVSERKFYLNYVGCKVKRFVIYIFGILRFTLTMWDVKLKDLLYTYSVSYVLP